MDGNIKARLGGDVDLIRDARAFTAKKQGVVRAKGKLGEGFGRLRREKQQSTLPPLLIGEKNIP